MNSIPFVDALVLACSSTVRCADTTGRFTIPKGQSQLFLDDQLIAEKNNVTRVWHQLRKHPSNPLMLKSGSEEAIYLFGTVLRESNPIVGGNPIFRMWYYAAGKGITWIA